MLQALASNTNAIVATAQELDDEDMSDVDGFEEADDSEEEERVDIRSLVKGKRRDPASSSSPVGIDRPPTKARKT
jgi:hypothetical protein